MTLQSPELRQLGATDLRVTPIGLGVMELSGGGGMLGYAFPRIPSEQKNAIIRAALDGGINWFDTAEMYGLGVSERALAEGLKTAGKSNGEVVIATKWLPLLRTAGNIPRSIETRLRHLGGFGIGNFMVHQPWSFSSPEAEMRAMAGLVRAGKIRSVGVSNFDADRMRRAQRALQAEGLPLAVNQMRFSLLDRRIETDGVIETARELGVTIIAYTPLESGLLSGKYHRDPGLLTRRRGWQTAMIRRKLESSRPVVEALERLAARHAATPAQVALNWVIHFHGESIVTIPGATRPAQAAEAAGAMRFRLSADELGELDQLTRAFRDV